MHHTDCRVGFTCESTTCVAAWDCKKGSDLTIRLILRGHSLDPKLTIGHCDRTRSTKRRCKSRSRAYIRHPTRHEGSPRKGGSCQQAAIAQDCPALLQTAQQHPVSHLALPLQRTHVSSSGPSENPLHLLGGSFRSRSWFCRHTGCQQQSHKPAPV